MNYKINGYAALFSIPDDGQDYISPGAFSVSLAQMKAPVPMLYQHDASRPIGRWTNITETGKGLWVEGELARGARLAEDVAALIAGQALSGLSIGYRVRRGKSGRGLIRRILTQIDLVEISLVTFPMQRYARVYSQ